MHRILSNFKFLFVFGHLNTIFRILLFDSAVPISTLYHVMRGIRRSNYDISQIIKTQFISEYNDESSSSTPLSSEVNFGAESNAFCCPLAKFDTKVNFDGSTNCHGPFTHSLLMLACQLQSLSGPF